MRGFLLQQIISKSRKDKTKMYRWNNSTTNEMFISRLANTNHDFQFSNFSSCHTKSRWQTHTAGMYSLSINICKHTHKTWTIKTQSFPPGKLNSLKKEKKWTYIRKLTVRPLSLNWSILESILQGSTPLSIPSWTTPHGLARSRSIPRSGKLCVRRQKEHRRGMIHNCCVFRVIHKREDS